MPRNGACKTKKGGLPATKVINDRAKGNILSRFFLKGSCFLRENARETAGIFGGGDAALSPRLGG